jgi:hypothetical protein
MEETKYGKYFMTGHRPWHPPGPGPVVANFDDTHMKGSNSYLIHWVLKAPTGIHNLTSWDQITHGPHIHKNPELLMHIGTNPDDPFDLGGEVEFYMGPEMEKHTVTKSTVVFIPANFVHCPWSIKRVDRPFMIIQVNQEPVHTEKALKQLVPEKDRDKMLFIDEGYGEERVYQMPKGMSLGDWQP